MMRAEMMPLASALARSSHDQPCQGIIAFKTPIL